ncbi:AAA family ATPase [Limosilactobacillus sp. STM2_1]|uniref:AAA family ATPase n=1 Tax=Limosilactobacillus rudii TaxID=2759755 RepID=A0A7W3YNM1_9LACO|nr:RNA polymerase recycling motor HelD [Limosilactobacillus rudii]MBB1079545.1 AAA family ATPase [Limosilactobacillus rudii]MBB1097591.1 AAA family ATPase [Limosilactobacillus rudii]MCD7134700.1 ATP-binding domain-containing protein [Limosilactobacillus rudii]
MSANTEKELEQKYLDNVIEKVKEAEQTAEKKIKTARHDIKGINKQIDDIHLNTTTYSGMMDTAMSFRAQQQMLDERQNSWQHAADRLATLKRLEKKPYFARIDFREKGAAEKETVYIGLASFTDRPDHFLVYDWRAPISSVYYEGKLGEVKYQTPVGEQEVDLTLKRQFQIKDGVIVTIFDTDEQVGDQMLLEALGNHSSTKMKSIVTTIQRKQNEIIRDTKDELLFVQGAAGSGKTAAVLQRVAWLLYRYRGNLTSSQVVLFSPNQLFNDYIDQVLPELGEHNMVQMTYFQFANRRVPKLHVQNLEQRFESHEDATAQNAQRLLTSLQYFNATERYAKHLGHANMRFRNLMFNGKVFLSKDKIKEIYYSFNNNYNLGNRLDGTKEELIRYLNRRVSSEMRNKWVEDEIQSLSKEEIDNLFGNQPREFEDEDKEYKFLARQIVMRAFMPIKKAIDHNQWLNINGQFLHFFRVTPKLVNINSYGISEEQWQRYVDNLKENLKQGKISANGITIYLYLYDLITGKHGQRDIRYVFVDEVQDYDAYQLAYLKYRFPRAKFTLLGDLNQAIFTHENSRSLLQQLGTMFDPEKTKVVQLTKSYRSTKQITDFTKHILVDGEAIEAFEREGAKPQICETKTEDEAVTAVVDALNKYKKEHDAVAIIGKTLADSEELYQKLMAQNVKTTLIRTENQRLVNGPIIVPSYLAKGLEFDAVIVWNANDKQYHGDGERQLLYTICSRAMHDLSLVSIGKVTSLINQVPVDEYKRVMNNK